MTKQEEQQQKQSEKIFDEFNKGFLDAVFYGFEIYKVSDSEIKHVPVLDYFTTE
jgi:hypothetical protein